MPGKPEAFIKGVEHVAIATPDPRSLAAWYIQHLNFEPLLDTGTTVYINSPNSVVLEFVKAEDVPARPQIRDAGLRHIAFAVDNLEAAHAQLQADGVAFEAAPILSPGMRLFFFRDPEGNYLHLVERKTRLI